MSVVAAAIVGSAVVGGVSSYTSSKNAASASNAATAASSQASAEQLEFAKQQYEDWKTVYGDIQENLSTYYNSLTPEKYIAEGKQSLNDSYAKASTQVEQSLAQRGLTGSGIQAQSITDLASNKANSAAALQATAERQVAQDKMSFLSLGTNQYNNSTNQVMNSYSNTANLAAQQASMYTTQANQASQAIGQSLSGGINAYLTYNSLQNQNQLLSKFLKA